MKEIKIEVHYKPIDSNVDYWDLDESHSCEDSYVDDKMGNVEDFIFSLKEIGRDEYDMSYEMKSNGRVNSRRLTVTRATCEVYDDDVFI
ncbi:MAG: hypothetical protein LUD72_06420 [Bacteroidales bacterium]|nr:hypothetical protein [Bacteroidales bacterium]